MRCPGSLHLRHFVGLGPRWPLYLRNFSFCKRLARRTLGLGIGFTFLSRRTLCKIDCACLNLSYLSECSLFLLMNVSWEWGWVRDVTKGWFKEYMEWWRGWTCQFVTVIAEEKKKKFAKFQGDIFYTSLSPILSITSHLITHKPPTLFTTAGNINPPCFSS